METDHGEQCLRTSFIEHCFKQYLWTVFVNSAEKHSMIKT
jgi:hypothetical protein